MKKHIYKVVFSTQGKVYEIRAKKVSQGTLFGFVQIDGIVHEEQEPNILMEPLAERMRTEFNGVERTYIPLHNVIRIDEVETKEVIPDPMPAPRSSKIANFPMHRLKPSTDPK